MHFRTNHVACLCKVSTPPFASIVRSSRSAHILTLIIARYFMQSLRVFRPLRTSLKLQFSPTARLQGPAFSTTASVMATEFKLKDVTSLSLKNGEKKEVEVEGVEGGKVLLLKVQDKVHATSANCTHYGAPLAKGVLTPEGRLTCPWHGGMHNRAARPRNTG
jgi:nitrite reductase/ring-hydroxylating ferredoxin subunit